MAKENFYSCYISLNFVRYILAEFAFLHIYFHLHACMIFIAYFNVANMPKLGSQRPQLQ